GLLADDIKAEMHLTEVQLSVLLGFAFTLLFGVAGLPLGWLADRWSRRGILFAGVIFWSLSSAGCGLATSFLTLFAVRAGVGIGEAALSPCAYSLLGALFRRERLGFAAAVYGVGSNLGGGAALAFGGMLVAAIGAVGGVHIFGLGDLPAWRAAFLFVAAP